MAAGAPLRILGSRVDPVEMDEAAGRMAQLLAEHRFAQVVTFGSEMAMHAHRDRAYRDVVNAADLVVPDTIGVVYAARLLGRPLRERVAGIELIERLCDLCARKHTSVFMLGAAPGVAREAADVLCSRHPGLVIAGCHDGYFGQAQESEVFASVAASGARVVLVALGFPRQELWVRAHAAELGRVLCVGVGGSFDVISGRLRRAPVLLRALGLEWLFRLVTQPHRLGRQLALPRFAALVSAQALHDRFAKRRSHG
jgi:N-acetylglucosaminyldiphosphoundecaprenol N-acetyl-beta-D-mannosaminyltransferase